MSLAEFIYTRLLRPRPLKAVANALLLKLIPEKIKCGPATIYLDREDPVVSGALTLGVFEQSEIAFFRAHCHGSMTLVDIGANVGLYTALGIHQLSGDAGIVAFEPEPGSCALLEKNIRANLENRAPSSAAPTVNTFNVAATSGNARQLLRKNPDNHGDNRLYAASDGETADWTSMQVDGRTVDSVLEEIGVRAVDFVKIDVQGYEQHAIEGFSNTLARSDSVVLLSEFWPQGLRDAGGSPEDYLSLLDDLGFVLYELRETPRGEIVPLDDREGLIARLSGRRYTNLVGFKGRRPDISR